MPHSPSPVVKTSLMAGANSGAEGRTHLSIGGAAKNLWPYVLILPQAWSSFACS